MESGTVRSEPKSEKGRDQEEIGQEETVVIRGVADKKIPPRGDRENYDLTSLVDNRMVRNYEPKFLAKGGEHIVYEVLGRKDVVVKVDARIIRKIQVYNAENGRPLDASVPDIMSSVKELLDDNRFKMKRIRDHFGSEHVPNIKQDFIKVPITPQMTYELHGKQPPAGWKDTREVWSIVKVQRSVPEVSLPGTKTMQFGYLEQRLKRGGTEYERITRALVDDQPPVDFDPKEIDALFGPMAEIVKISETDESCAAVLRDFTQKAISYADKQGEILDLAGKDNAVFFEKDGKWDYKLIDALYGGDNGALKLTEPILRKFAAGEKLANHESNHLLNVVNFVRGINGLAARLGMTERVEIVPDDLKGKIDFFAAIEL